MDDQLEEIRQRKEKRNFEIEQISETKENDAAKEEVQPKLDETSQLSVYRHTFTPSKEAKPTATITTPSASVKSLRNRWELSSATGTPLHPDNKDDDLYAAAIRLTKQRRNPSTSTNSSIGSKLPTTNSEKMTPKQTHQLSGMSAVRNSPRPQTVETPTRALGEFSHQVASLAATPNQLKSPLRTDNEVEVESQIPPQPYVPSSPSASITIGTGCSTRSGSPTKETIASFDYSTSVQATDSKSNEAQSSSHTDNFRPVTPTDEIIGSLWDDINSELQKYKEAKKSQPDPNLSPRSRFSTESMFRTQGGSAFKRGVERVANSSQSADYDFTTSFSSHALPEKRQRSDSENIAQSSETVNIGIGIPSEREAAVEKVVARAKTMKDETDSASSTVTINQDAYLRRLHERIIVQQDQICQASRALAFCRQNDHFRGGREEVDAQRALLISMERRKLLLQERDNIATGRSQLNPSNEPKGTLTISSILIRLSREYVNNFVQHPSATSRYYFIVLLKCGTDVYHTSLASSENGVKNGFIEFSHNIQISGLLPNFACEVEVHSLKASQEGEANDRSARSKKGTWRRMVISTPMNAYSNTLSAYSTGGNAHRPIGVIDSGFQKVGHLKITRQLINRQKFLLNDPVFPLDGTSIFNMDCHPDKGNAQTTNQHRSFLSFYQIISGFGSWNRYWCLLADGKLSFWRYPEDEVAKESTLNVDLTLCVTPVTAVPSSIASFPNSMQLDVVLPPTPENDKKEGIRMLFAADSPEEMRTWIESINQEMRNANIWRSTKQK